VDLILNEFFGFAEEFTREDGHSGGAITHFCVLGFADVDEDASGRVVNVDGA